VRLEDPKRPLRLHAVITDWALEIPVGGRELQQEQLRHLIRMAEHATPLSRQTPAPFDLEKRALVCVSAGRSTPVIQFTFSHAKQSSQGSRGIFGREAGWSGAASDSLLLHGSSMPLNANSPGISDEFLGPSFISSSSEGA
jgi:hypothetical protein